MDAEAEDKVAAEDDIAENGLELSPPKALDLLMLFRAKRGTFVGTYLIGAAKASALLEVFRPAFVNDNEKDEDERLKVEMNTMILREEEEEEIVVGCCRGMVRKGGLMLAVGFGISFYII